MIARRSASCLVCSSLTVPVISFGKMPIANGFLMPDQFNSEPFYDLDVVFCPTCTMIQLANLVEPGKMFHENYAFFSSTSSRMIEHFKEFSSVVLTDYVNHEDPLIVEIGSNDGIMLQNFAAREIRHV